MDSRNNNSCFFLPLLLFLFFFFSIKPHLSFAADTISAGESLTGNQTIISKYQTFALGFFTPGKSLNFYIGIWYYKVSTETRTVVWVANREKPIKDPTTAELRVLGNGNLVLTDQSENLTIWSTNSTLTPLNSTEAVLGDDGNLVLRDGLNTSNVIWESFDNPTNTWLSGGKLGLHKRRNKTQLLTSWRNEEDPAPGIFSLELDPNDRSRFIGKWNESIPFWNTGEWFGQNTNEVPDRRSNNIDRISSNIDNFRYIPNEEESYVTYTLINKSIATRFVMDISGQFRQVTWLEESNQWNVFWSQPRASCDVYGRCGSNGICNETTEPSCDCLPGFNRRFPESWSLSDTTGGCVRNTSLQCGNEHKFLRMPNMKMPPSSALLPRSIEDCKSTCSDQCLCTAYSHGSRGCSLWVGDLLNFEQVLDGNNTVGDLYLKLASSEIQNAGGSMEKKISIDEKKGANKMIIITTVLIGIVIISVCTYFSWRWMAKHRGRKKKNSNVILLDAENPSSESSDQNMLGDNPDLKIFSFEELIIGTNNFSESNKLGEGGFGSVYKGELPDGQVIAIKRLSKSSGQGLQEFKNEVVVISKLQHRNLVRLLGCCIAGEEKILIYEYMPNNSLDTYLFGSDPSKRGLLDWGKRFQIIEGISRGILYLHRDSRLKVIHRDLKPSNVLLDEELNPKISDFGMARIFGSNELQANTNRVVGTYGYMSPEYAMEGQFSEKSDVFSFGVVLLEIVSGRRNTSFYNHDQSLSLLKHAWLLWNENKIHSLIESTLSGQPHFELEIVRCIHVGLLCVQEFANDRPTMSTTLLMLTSENATLPTPKQPAFTQGLPSSHSNSHEHTTFSGNTITLTSVGGR